MHLAIIESDEIINIIVGELEWAVGVFPEVSEAPSGADIGWKRVEGVWTPPVSPEAPVVNVTRISRRQGLLTIFEEEGKKESDVQALIDSIEDENQRYVAQVELANQYWEIQNPLIQQLAMDFGWDEERLQELFNIAATK